MNNTKIRQSHEHPRIGEVVRLFDGAFGTAVVVDQFRLDNGPYFKLYRPHLSFKNGIPVPCTEITEISLSSLMSLPVHVTTVSGKIENRNI